MKDQTRLFALIVYSHRVLGYLALPYLLSQENRNFYTPEYVINEETLPSVIDTGPQWLPKAAGIAAVISEVHLAKRFSQNKKPVDFLRELDDQVYQKLVRPFLDKQVDQLLKMALQYDIPVYSGNQSTSIFPEMKLEIKKDEVVPWFNFTRGEEGTTYILEIRHHESKININQEGNVVLAFLPCWLKSGSFLYSFPAGFDGKKLKPFLKKESIAIPPASESKYFRAFIMKNLKTGHVNAQGFDILDTHPEPGLELSLEHDWQGNAVMLAYARYGNKRVLIGDQSDVFIDLVEQGDAISFNHVYRKREWESAAIRKMTAMGLKTSNDNTFSLSDDAEGTKTEMLDLVEWINKHSDELTALPATLIKADDLPAYFTGKIKSEWREDQGPDWFDILGTVSIGAFEFPFIKFRKHILEGQRTFTLPDGKIAVLPEEWFSEYRDIMLMGTEKEGGLRVKKWHQALMPNKTRDGGMKKDFSALEFDFSRPAPVKVPDELNATLRSYQEEGFQWMHSLYKKKYGGCLADDMGLGKTIQALAMLLSRKNGSGKPSLVLVPATLIHNWVSEIEKFTPSLSFYVHTGNHRAESPEVFKLYDIVLTTYGILRNDINMLSGFPFSHIILDESQAIKNPEAKVSKAVMKLEGAHRLVLTGTPIENSLHDLWSQMNFLNPGLLGSHRVFEQEFLSRVVQDEAVAKKLKNLIAPFILRRRKQEVEPELPPLTEEVLYCEMSGDHKKYYEAERSAIRRQVLENMEQGKSSHKSIAVFRALTRLRQIANHPFMIDEEYASDSGKFEHVRNVLDTLTQEGNKVLVFSSFVKHLNIIAEWLEEEGRPYSILTGQTRDRQQVIEQFRKEEERKIFLISLKAGGTGLNLTEAGYVLMLDPWWNPASEQQAIHRAHRIGQEKPVIAYKFITQDSIEEKILKLQEKKKKLYVDFIPAENPLEELSREEVEELFE